MSDFFVTTLVSLREIAQKSGCDVLADELDVAILIAVCEAEEINAEGGNGPRPH